VQGLWEGLLPLHEQDAVLLRVEGGKHILEPPHFEALVTNSQVGTSNSKVVFPSIPGPVLKIDEGDLHALGTNHTVIDLRERDSIVHMRIENEVNIPFPELDVRARIELKPDIPIIVDCSSVDVGTCDLAALSLVSLRFVSVSVLDRGFRGMACGITPARES
jgi:rhodanese-related sulfurtransferase